MTRQLEKENDKTDCNIFYDSRFIIMKLRLFNYNLRNEIKNCYQKITANWKN